MKYINHSEIAAAASAILRRYRISRQSPLKREALFAIVRTETGDSLLTDRQLRKAIAREAPWICSCERGYYLPVTDDDVIAAARYLKRKADGLYGRRAKILAHFPDIERRQGELGL